MAPAMCMSPGGEADELETGELKCIAVEDDEAGELRDIAIEVDVKSKSVL